LANPQSALGAWLDSESSYRLTVEKAEEATEGADYARNQYEKYNTAYLDAKKTLDQINKQNAEERSGLMDERDLIKQIMVMIGVRNPHFSRICSVLEGTNPFWGSSLLFVHTKTFVNFDTYCMYVYHSISL
jgi:hypothetical protein